ncbi:LuxR C-terminal-related transcriptional regulator [Streptomyces yokosukanensis]|uniref:LuxR C-terminal-related transcriptional regulator n=1 Tax=Streptomyces yokosukanensis TaxID=67386 RepID=UPI0034323D42
MYDEGVRHGGALPARTARHLLSRPRLTRRLDAALSARITAIVAPAGYGKTSLVSQWLDTSRLRERRVAVISLCERDDDLSRITRHLIDAVERLGVDEVQVASLESALREEGRDPARELPEVFLRRLRDAFDEVPTRAVLVLEDVHVLHRENVLLVLDHLADVLPPPVHLMLTSRTSTPLRRAHTLRLRGELDELNVTELAFTTEEAHAYLSEAAGSLTEQQASLLARRCDGWIAGLQLAGRALLSHRDPDAFLRDFTGHNRDIAEFLLYEVLRHQPDGVRDFLLDASVLEVLSADVCQAVTTRRDSGTLLRTLEGEGGFLLGLDDGERYRFHPLFAEFLRGELARTDPDRAGACRLRAAHWFAHHDQLTAAFEHAVAAPDFPLAGSLLNRIVTHDTGHQLDDRLEPLFARLPRHIIERHPALSARMAYLALWADQPADALLWCEHTEKLPDNDDAVAEARCMRVFAHWMLGDLHEAIACSERARTLLDRREPLHRHRDTYPRLAMLEGLAEAYECTGRFDAAMDVIREGLDRAREGVHPLVAVSFPGKRAALLSRLGRLDDVREFAELSLATAEQLGQADQPPTIEARVALGELLWEHDDLAGAEREFRAAERLCAVADRVWMRARSLTGLARTLFHQRRTTEAFNVLRDAMGIDPRGALPHFVRVRIAEQQFRLRLAHHDPTGARGWLSELKRHGADAELCAELLAWLDLAHDANPRAALSTVEDQMRRRSHRSTQTLIRLRVLASRAARACGESKLSGQYAVAAVTLAAPQMMVRTLAEAAGDDSDWLLRLGTRGGPRTVPAFTDAVTRLSERDAALTSGMRPAPERAAERLLEPLTPAELDLIPFLAMELTYAEIATHRFVSVNTVKSQMQAVYRKLGVTSRIAAIERSRALGMHPTS